VSNSGIYIFGIPYGWIKAIQNILKTGHVSIYFVVYRKLKLGII